MDPFSIIVDALSFSPQFIAMFVSTGYWIFFLIFYGTKQWGKNRLEWPDRLLLSFPLGCLFVFICMFPSALIYRLANEFHFKINIEYILLGSIILFLAFISLKRFDLGIPFGSDTTYSILRLRLKNRNIIWPYLIHIPILLFGSTCGLTNQYISKSSRMLWSFGIPYMGFISSLFMILFIFILCCISFFVRRNNSKTDAGVFLDYFFPLTWIRNSISKVPSIKISKTSKKQIGYIFILVILPLSISFVDPLLVLFTPSIQKVDVSQIASLENTVIKHRWDEEAYLIPTRIVYDLMMPQIPLMNITLLNPSDNVLYAGSKLSYETVFFKPVGDFSISFHIDDLGKTLIEIEPKWTSNKTSKVILDFYNNTVHSNVVEFLNKTTIEEGKKFKYYYTIQHSENLKLKIDDYYLIPPDNFANFAAYLNGQRLVEIRKYDDWLVIRNLYLWGSGTHSLIVDVELKS